MIPVEQRGRFDCMTACLASIFECPYEDAPVLSDPETGAGIEDWWRVYEKWLADRGWMTLQRVRTEGDGDPEWCPWNLPGYWIAGVKSPRVAGEHAIVMSLNAIVWDPHPERARGHHGFTSCDYFLPLDPARFVLKAAA